MTYADYLAAKRVHTHDAGFAVDETRMNTAELVRAIVDQARQHDAATTTHSLAGDHNRALDHAISARAIRSALRVALTTAKDNP